MIIKYTYALNIYTTFLKGKLAKNMKGQCDCLVEMFDRFHIEFVENNPRKAITNTRNHIKLDKHF